MSEEPRKGGFPQQSAVVRLNLEREPSPSPSPEQTSPPEAAKKAAAPAPEAAKETIKEQGAAPTTPYAEPDWKTGGVKPIKPEAVGGPYVITGFVSVLWIIACTAGGFWILGAEGAPAPRVLDLLAVVGAAFAPLAFLWLVVAYIDRGTSIRAEAAALRQQLALLSYPDQAGKERVAAISQSLRSQARDLSGATRYAADQAEAMRQVLSTETRELSRLNDQIDGETRQALSKIGTEVQNLNAVMRRITDMAKENDLALVTRQLALDEASERANQAAEALASTMKEKIEEVAEILDRQVSAASTSLRKQADSVVIEVESQIAALVRTLDAKGKDLSKIITNSTGALSDQAATVMNQVEGKMIALTNTLESKGEQLSHSLDASADMLSGQAAAMTGELEGRISVLSDALDAKTASLSKDLSSQTDAINAHAKAVHSQIENHLSAVMASLEAKAQQMTNTIAANADALDQQAEGVANRLEDRLSSLVSAVDARGAQLTKVVISSADALQQQANALIASLAGQAEQLSLEMKAQGERLDQNAEAALAYLQKQATVVSASLSDQIAAMGRTVEQNAGKLASVLHQETKALATVSGEMSDRTAAVQDLLARQDIQIEAARTATSALSAASEALCQRVDEVTRTLAKRTLTFEDAGKALVQQAAGIGVELQHCLDQSDHLTKGLVHQAGILAEQHAKIASAGQTATQELDAATAAALNDFNAFRDSASDVIAQAKQSAEAIQSAAEQADGVRRLISAQTSGLEQAARILSESVRAAGDAVEDQGAAINQTVDKASERIRHMADLLARHAVDVTRTTARATVEIEAVSEGVKSRLSELQTSAREVKDASRLINSESEHAVDAIRSVAKAVESGAAGLCAASVSFAEDAERITDAANGALAVLSRLGQEMHRETDQLFSSADATLTKAQGLRDALEAALESFEDGVARSSERVDSTGERLRVSAEVFEATALHAAEAMGEVGDDLEQRLSDLSQAANGTVGSIQNAVSTLNKQQTLLDDAGERAIQTMRQTTSELALQAEGLLGAAEVAQKRAKELQIARDRVELQKFLKDTSYAVEKLQSTAVDITRLFTPTVEEDLWKRFYKGEQNAFLRHAAKTITRQQAAAVRKMFMEDVEFRDYAVRYMSEYETLIKAARLNDRADVLTAVFTSSDMGRLYTTLARATDRGGVMMD